MVPTGHLFLSNEPLSTVEEESHVNPAIDRSFNTFHTASNQKRTLTEKPSFESDSHNPHFLQDIQNTCETSLHSKCSFQQGTCC
jgi:hypothetical protein